jgi:predicted N-formylglutamate amidohydrolase
MRTDQALGKDQMKDQRSDHQHPAFCVTGADRPGPWLVICDHATNRVPDWLGGTLGLGPADMARHIAYDPGAQGVALALGQALDSPVLCADFSRLVIDPNRGEHDPTLVMQIYDRTIIPANCGITPDQVQDRLDRLYRPYHAACAALAAGRVIVSVHSFTPCLRGGSPRPWQVGVLYSHRDARLSHAVLALMQDDRSLCVGDNQPYSGHLPGDAIDRHALRHARHNTLIELRNDLITTEADQMAWASRLAPLLVAALARVQGSGTGAEPETRGPTY